MIKNFFVKTERIKSKTDGVIKYLKYLEDDKDPRHSNNEIIKIYNLSRNFFNICNKNCTNLDYQNSSKGGRKVESYAQSFDFSFPPGIDVTEEEYKEFSLKIIQVLKNNFPDLNDNEIFMNVHKNIKVKENESPGHLNLLVSRVSFDKKTNKYINNYNLDQKSICFKLKQEFNLFIVNKYNLDHNNYVLKKHKKGVNKPLFLARQEKNAEIEKEIIFNESKLNTIKEEINNIEKDVNILNISKNDLEKEVNKLILDIGTKDKKAKDLTDLIKTSNQNANKKLNKVKEEIEKLKKEKESLKEEKESLKEFEEKINQSNLAKIIDNAGTFIDIVKEKFTKHKTIKKLIEEFEEKITKQTQEIFDLTNGKEEIKSNSFKNITNEKNNNTKEKDKIKKDFEEEIKLKDKIINVLEKEIKKIDPQNEIIKKIKIK